MTEYNIRITPSEWNIMECLWEKAPCTGREVVEYIKETIGWTRSTTLTFLRRMTTKGIVKCDSSGEMRIYSPILQREKAIKHETNDFINRVYKGSVSAMMSTIAKKQKLSQKEINELFAILSEAEEVNKND